MKKPKFDGHYFYVARKNPDNTCTMVERRRALQWHVEFTVITTYRFSEGLQECGDGELYYFQRTVWHNVDLLTAFDVPCVNADDTRVTINLVTPQAIINADGSKSVAPHPNPRPDYSKATTLFREKGTTKGRHEH